MIELEFEGIFFLTDARANVLSHPFYVSHRIKVCFVSERSSRVEEGIYTRRMISCIPIKLRNNINPTAKISVSDKKL